VKPLLASAFLFLSTLTFGQGGYQIADTTKTWNTIHYGWASWMVWNCGGTTTTRLTDQYSPGDHYLDVLECQDSLMQSWNHRGFIREDTLTKQVFFGWSADEGLIYDFSLETGDTVQVENLYLNHDVEPLVCDSIDQVNINGEMKKRFYLFNTSSSERNSYYPDEIWIEGVGSNFGILQSGFGALGGAGGTVSMLCCNQNGNTIYMDSMFNKCYYDTFYPQIIQNTYDTAYLDTYYEFQVLVDTGDAASIELIGEVIPEGFSFDTSTGLLSGTPSQTGAFPCIIQAKNLELNALTDMIYEDIVVVLPTATGANPRQGFKIYPNPFKFTLNVELQQAVASQYWLEIYSSEGRQLEKVSFQGNVKIELSSLRSGLFLVRITDAHGQVICVERVLKQ
jgi:hypothetical protein